MGWWSDTVLGGDTPLDIVCDLEKTLGIEELYPVRGCWDDNKRDLLRKAFEAKWPEVLKHLSDKEHWWSSGDNHSIAIQVVAVIAMAAGAEFPKGFKERALKAAEDDEWANEGDGGRRVRMVELKKAIEAYKPGTPAEVAEKGLMEKIYEVMG